MTANDPAAPEPETMPVRRPLRLLDLMTLISPAVMRAIIPANALHNWDRRQSGMALSDSAVNGIISSGR